MRVHVGRRAKRLENAATTVQTHIADEGERRASEPARAAASCRRRDLVRRLTAGKTEFVKSEPPLMRKNTDTCPNTASQPIRKKTKNPGLPWEQRRHQSSRAVLEQACAHKQQNSERSRGECTPTLTPAGCWIASGCRVCTYVCVRVRFPLARSQLSACSARLAMCASVHVHVCEPPAGQVPYSP